MLPRSPFKRAISTSNSDSLRLSKLERIATPSTATPWLADPLEASPVLGGWSCDAAGGSAALRL